MPIYQYNVAAIPVVPFGEQIVVIGRKHPLIGGTGRLIAPDIRGFYTVKMIDEHDVGLFKSFKKKFLKYAFIAVTFSLPKV